jgi:5-methylcytosine-specific restriction endonuclease McrA
MAVYQKFDGHCAYCGEALEFKRMQVDHFWPQLLARHEPELDNNRFSNLMPSCAKCNNHKHGMRPETWRKQIYRQVEILRRNANLQRALRYGQISITRSPIVFYFEKVSAKENAVSDTAQMEGPNEEVNAATNLKGLCSVCGLVPVTRCPQCGLDADGEASGGEAVKLLRKCYRLLESCFCDSSVYEKGVAFKLREELKKVLSTNPKK